MKKILSKTLHWMRPVRKNNAPQGVALLIALLVIALLTVFISELFFSSSIYLGRITTLKSLYQSKDGARAALTVMRQALLQDEVKFFEQYRAMKSRVDSKGFSWQEGAMVELQVEPLDHRFNINTLGRFRPGKDIDLIRWNIFWNLMQDIITHQDQWFDDGSMPISLNDGAINNLYAAINDWLDSDALDYNGIAGVQGGEASAYFTQTPKIDVKNAPLDSLNEIMLVRGVSETKIPWRVWRHHFVILPVVSQSSQMGLEKINVNTASKEELITHLRIRNITQQLSAFNIQTVQKALAQYANRALEVTEVLIPEGEKRVVYDEEKLKETLERLGFADKYGVNELFSTYNQFYRVRVGVRVGEVVSRLEAKVYVKRLPKTRTGVITKLFSINWL